MICLCLNLKGFLSSWTLSMKTKAIHFNAFQIYICIYGKSNSNVLSSGPVLGTKDWVREVKTMQLRELKALSKEKAGYEGLLHYRSFRWRLYAIWMVGMESTIIVKREGLETPTWLPGFTSSQQSLPKDLMCYCDKPWLPRPCRHLGDRMSLW